MSWAKRGSCWVMGSEGESSGSESEEVLRMLAIYCLFFSANFVGASLENSYSDSSMVST